jgi:hypothetical protein
VIGVADTEGIDTSGCKLKRDYLETIRLYRELDGGHNAKEIEAMAQAEGVKTEGLKLKRDFVNAIVAFSRAKR